MNIYRRATKKWQVVMIVLLVCTVVAVAAVVSGWTPARGIGTDREYQAWLKNRKETAQQPDRILTIGIVPYMTMYYETLVKNDALVSYLSGETGLDVRLNVFNSYQEIIEAVARQKIDIAMLGALGFIEANRMGDAECLLQLTLDGKPFYEGLIFTKPDSGIRSLQDLRGRSFVFVDPSSTSGYLFPRALLLENGIDPDEDFSEYSFAGSHTESVMSVAMGRADAGAATIMDLGADMRELFDEGKLEVIANTARVPADPLVVRKGLDMETREKVAAAYIKVTDPDTAAKIFDDPEERWIRCDEKAFEPVKKLAGLE